MKELEGISGSEAIETTPDTKQLRGECGEIVKFPAESVLWSPKEDIGVERINQFSFYELGQKFKALTSHIGDVKPTVNLWVELVSADMAVDELLKGNPIPIGVCRASVELLSGVIGNMIHDFFFKKDEDTGQQRFVSPTDDVAPIPSWRWSNLITAISTFETVFNAEMREVATYFVPRHGIYSTPALIDSADDSFPSVLLPYIPSKTRDDWKASGRCLAFSLWSASGFHAARAVEGTVEVYWRQFTGAAADATLHSWNDYIQALEAIANTKPSPSPTKKTLTELRQMKDDYRNPIMHPRVILDESDCRMLFNNSESLIIAMADELRIIQQTQGGVQGALSVVGGTEAS